LLYSIFVCGLIYPIFGSWAWGSLFNGSGWLEGLGFIDFAGSTVVHSVGGWAALAGAIVLGPRWANTRPTAVCGPSPGHNMPLGALGVFILWLGWFGFNPGSTTTADKSIAMIFVNTNLAAATGAILAMITSWMKFGKPEVSMSLNGALAGLVGITAGCANVSPASSIHYRRRCRHPGGLLGAVFRQNQSRRPGRCRFRPWGQRRLGHPGGRHLQYRRHLCGIIGVQLLGIAACFSGPSRRRLSCSN
jgi:hypothetical protein